MPRKTLYLVFTNGSCQPYVDDWYASFEQALDSIVRPLFAKKAKACSNVPGDEPCTEVTWTESEFRQIGERCWQDFEGTVFNIEEFVIDTVENHYYTLLYASYYYDEKKSKGGYWHSTLRPFATRMELENYVQGILTKEELETDVRNWYCQKHFLDDCENRVWETEKGDLYVMLKTPL